MASVDFLHHENLPTWAGVEPGQDVSDKPTMPSSRLIRDSLHVSSVNRLLIFCINSSFEGTQTSQNA
ncbi:hypothetical protein TNCV_2907981 [Trichonephila clavipes]|nr:hypothetical protein TNCV_2907981 [Trichonephila clavipes]